jgi:hypothetical protein
VELVELDNLEGDSDGGSDDGSDDKGVVEWRFEPEGS